jgi:SAM-dependent methyltransferase
LIDGTVDFVAPMNDAFLQKLADPVDGSPLSLLEDRLISPSGRAYAVCRGAPQLLADMQTLAGYFGARNLAAWRLLQEEAERSYRTRTEGHFSTETVAVALDYGAFVASLPAGEVLDIGCGKLARPAYMAGAHRFFGIDPMALEAARSFDFARAYADFLPFRSGAFDHAIFASSIDHAINPLRALEEASRVVRPGGTVSAWVSVRPANDVFVDWTLRSQFFTARYNTHHNWAFSSDSLVRLFKMAGLRKVRVRPTSSPLEVIAVGKAGPLAAPTA